MNDKPQQPPEIRRELSFDGKQIAGILFILIFPVLVLSGVLEPRIKSIQQEDNGIETILEYSDLLRYQKNSFFTLVISNKTGETASQIQVRINRSYIRNFSNISFSPEPEYISDREYIFNAGVLESGESRIIHTELKPEKVGKLSGRILISGLTEDREMFFETLVLP